MDEKTSENILDLLEEQRKILELSVEKEKTNYHQESLVRISERMDELIIRYYRNNRYQNKMKKHKLITGKKKK